MRQNIVRVAFLCFFLFTVDGFFSVAQVPSLPGPTTPTSLVMTVNSVEISDDDVLLKDRTFETLFDIPSSIDVMSETGGLDNVFGIGVVPGGVEYLALRLNLAGTGRYTGTDPCNGESVANADIQLPGGSDGVVVINYQWPHPIAGLPEGTLPMQLLKITAASIELRLVFLASNSVVCSSDAGPLRTIMGESTGLDDPLAIYVDTVNDEIGVTNSLDDSVTIYKRTDTGDVIPLRTLRGTNTGLSSPGGIYLDSVNDEIGVANGGDNSVLIYDRTAEGDVAPLRTIHGPNTGLFIPLGIALYLNPEDPDGDEIVVANGGNSVTIYSRTAEGDDAPLRTLIGNATGLSFPAGIALYLDPVDPNNDEIVVANNGNDSVTIYRRTASGNVAPLRTLGGTQTDLSDPGGIYVDRVNNEIGVANSGNNSVTIYSRTASGNVHALRTIVRDSTGLSDPVGIYVDTDNNEIGVANRGNDSLTVHKRYDDTVQLKRLPVLVSSADELSLFARYLYTGTIDRDTGGGDISTLQVEGYNFVLRFTDPTSARLRQPGDISNAMLIPPSEIVFQLANGSPASNLAFGCPQFTPFSILQLSTNCPPSPLIVSPLPAVSAEYTVTATMFGELTMNTLPFTPSSVPESEFPRPVPTLTLPLNNTIEKIDWIYINEAGEELTSPLIISQRMVITLTRDFDDVSACYTLVAGNAANLAYASDLLSPSVRSLSEIKNNRCDIFLDDVESISFTIKDALGNTFSFEWEVA